MRRRVDLYEVYGYRIRAIEALRSAFSGKSDADALEAAIASFRARTEDLGDARGRKRYSAFATLLDALLLLMRWARAVREAEVDADRFLRAARQSANDLLSDSASAIADDDPLMRAAQEIITVGGVERVPGIAGLLLSIPLPLPLYAEPTEFWGRRVEERGHAAKPSITVAFVSFTLYDVPFGNPQFVEPQVLHDLSVEVLVSRWPETADALVLGVASVEPSEAYDFPGFTFQRPSGSAPHLLHATGRMVLKIRQALLSRPLEFAYRARFAPPVEGVEIRVEGQRRLRVQSYDPERQSLTGYKQIDPVILRIRDEARSAPGIGDKELDDFLRILSALGNVAGQALQGNVFPEPCDERRFQTAVRALLRQRSDFGSELQEHPHAAGGITDLSFRGIPLELKVVSDKFVSVTDAEVFLPQTAAYAAAADRRFGVLVVLDCSVKREPAGSAANDIVLRELPPQSGGSLPLLIGVVIVRGNLPKPSSL